MSPFAVSSSSDDLITRDVSLLHASVHMWSHVIVLSRVAVDPSGEARQQLMAAAKVSCVPHSFVVDQDGVVRFSGHPMDPGWEAFAPAACRSAHAPADPAAPPCSASPAAASASPELSARRQARCPPPDRALILRKGSRRRLILGDQQSEGRRPSDRGPP